MRQINTLLSRKIISFILVFTFLISSFMNVNLLKVEAAETTASGDASVKIEEEKNDLVSEKTEDEKNEGDASDDASPYVVFIGDSYAEGYNPDLGSNITSSSWPVLAANLLNCNNYIVKAKGGTGFAYYADGKNFLNLLQEAAASVSDKNAVNDLVICGGYNDLYYDYSTIKSNVLETIAYAKQNFPNAKIVIGMIGADVGNKEYEEKIFNVVKKAYADAASEAGVYYLTNGEYVLQNADNVFSSDSHHPNVKGQLLIAEYVHKILTSYNTSSDSMEITYHSNYKNTDTTVSDEVSKSSQGEKLASKEIFALDFGNATFLGWSKLRDGVAEYQSNTTIDPSWLTANYPSVDLYASWLPSVSANYTGMFEKSNGYYYFVNGKLASNYTGLFLDAYTQTNTLQQYYVQKGIVYKSLTSLVYLNNSWHYIENGIWNADYKGLVKYNGSWFYVQNGIVNGNYTGLVNHSGGWYYVEKGVWKQNYTNLYKYNGTWYYIKNGAIDWSCSTLAQVNNSGTWYKVTKGKVDWSYTGLAYYGSKWYYVKSGRVDWSYSGLASYNNGWFYVSKGVVDWNYSGMVSYNGTWYYVQKGKIDWTVNTLAQVNNSGTWYKVTKGKLDWSYTGLAYYGSKWYYVKSGRLDWTYSGLVSYNNTWFYVSKGVIDWNYTNLVEYKGNWYYVQNAKINWSANTLAQLNGKGTWYKVTAGKCDFTYTGLYYYQGKYFYLSQGKVDWTYSGTLTYNGKKYEVKNGVAV
jgi:hypothetical protein